MKDILDTNVFTMPKASQSRSARSGDALTARGPPPSHPPPPNPALLHRRLPLPPSIPAPLPPQPPSQIVIHPEILSQNASSSSSSSSSSSERTTSNHYTRPSRSKPTNASASHSSIASTRSSSSSKIFNPYQRLDFRKIGSKPPTPGSLLSTSCHSSPASRRRYGGQTVSAVEALTPREARLRTAALEVKRQSLAGPPNDSLPSTLSASPKLPAKGRPSSWTAVGFALRRPASLDSLSPDFPGWSSGGGGSGSSRRRSRQPAHEDRIPDENDDDDGKLRTHAADASRSENLNSTNRVNPSATSFSRDTIKTRLAPFSSPSTNRRLAPQQRRRSLLVLDGDAPPTDRPLKNPFLRSSVAASSATMTQSCHAGMLEDYLDRLSPEGLSCRSSCSDEDVEGVRDPPLPSDSNSDKVSSGNGDSDGDNNAHFEESHREPLHGSSEWTSIMANLLSTSELMDRELSNGLRFDAPTSDNAGIQGSQRSTVDPTGRTSTEADRINRNMTSEAPSTSPLGKFLVKVYNEDGSSKTILAHESMTVAEMVQLLIQKNGRWQSVNWSVVESLPDTHLEQLLEDSWNVSESISHWTKDTQNRLVFKTRWDKYDLFSQPQNYLFSPSAAKQEFDTAEKEGLIQQLFSSSSSADFQLPHVEGYFHARSDAKKSWKKNYLVLRNSGLYFCSKTKPKSDKDLLFLTALDRAQIFEGVEWKKRLKSPGDFGFALRFSARGQKVDCDTLHYFCCEEEGLYRRWMAALRLAKYGRQLYDDFKAFTATVAEKEAKNKEKALLDNDKFHSVGEGDSKLSLSPPEIPLPPVNMNYATWSPLINNRRRKTSFSGSSQCSSSTYSGSSTYSELTQSSGCEADVSDLGVKSRPTWKPPSGLSRDVKSGHDGFCPESNENLYAQLKFVTNPSTIGLTATPPQQSSTPRETGIARQCIPNVSSTPAHSSLISGVGTKPKLPLTVGVTRTLARTGFSDDVPVAKVAPREKTESSFEERAKLRELQRRNSDTSSNSSSSSSLGRAKRGSCNVDSGYRDTLILEEEINALSKDISFVSDVFNEEARWAAAYVSTTHGELETTPSDCSASKDGSALPRTSSPLEYWRGEAERREENRLSVLSLEDLPPPPPEEELLADQDLPLPPPPPPMPVAVPPEPRSSLAGKLKTSQTEFLRERNPFLDGKEDGDFGEKFASHNPGLGASYSSPGPLSCKTRLNHAVKTVANPYLPTGSPGLIRKNRVEINSPFSLHQPVERERGLSSLSAGKESEESQRGNIYNGDRRRLSNQSQLSVSSGHSEVSASGRDSYHSGSPSRHPNGSPLKSKPPPPPRRSSLCKSDKNFIQNT